MAITGGIVAAGAAVGGSMLSSSAASSAAGAQESAANNSTALEQAVYSQNQKNLSGYMATGSVANDALSNLYGLNPTTGQYQTQDSSTSQGQALTELEGLSGVSPTLSGVNSGQAFNNAYTQFQNSPTYQFALSQGGQALDRSAASKGLLLSGAQLKDSQAFGQGLASQGLSQFTSNLTNLYNGLTSGITGLSSLGQSSATQSNNNGLASAGQIGSSLTNAGIAQASGILGSANYTNQGVQNALGALGSNNTSFGGQGSALGQLGNLLSGNSTPSWSGSGTSSLSGWGTGNFGVADDGSAFSGAGVNSLQGWGQ